MMPCVCVYISCDDIIFPITVECCYLLYLNSLMLLASLRLLYLYTGSY